MLVRRAKGYWKSIENQRQFFDECAQVLKIRTASGWYKVSGPIISDLGGRHIVDYFYGASIPKCISTLYPNFKWKTHLFKGIPNGHWDALKNRRQLFEDIGKKFKVRTFDAWYNVSLREIVKQPCGNIAVNVHNGSVYDALKTIYPEYDWKPWLFRAAPNGYWDSLENQKQALHGLADTLNVCCADDWKKIDIIGSKYAAMRSIVKRYNHDLEFALNTLAPNSGPKLKRYVRPCWFSKSTQRKFLEKLAHHFDINEESNMDAWYHVSQKQLAEYFGAGGFIRYYHRVLRLVYPNVSWDWDRFKLIGKRSKQRWLIKAVRKCVEAPST